MAYIQPGQKSSNNSFRSNSTAAAAPTPAGRRAPGEVDPLIIFSTGLFVPEKGKAAGTVKVKEDLVIPAGSYINLYENDSTKENAPKYRMQIRKLGPKSS